MFSNPSDLLFQHLPVREKVKNTEVKRLMNDFNKDILTSEDIEELVELGRKVIKI